jgi:hypothetical protein
MSPTDTPDPPTTARAEATLAAIRAWADNHASDEFVYYAQAAQDVLALLDAAPLDRWRAIETANPSAQVIGAFFHATYGWIIAFARHHDDPFVPGGYWMMDGGGKPTHWLPQPDPPVLRHAAPKETPTSVMEHESD